MKQKALYISISLIAGLILGWLLFYHSASNKSIIYESSEVSKNIGWTCSMHPQIRVLYPGKCPICGMDLIPLSQNDSTSDDPDVIKLSREAAELANVLTTRAAKQKPVKEVRLFGRVQIDERLFQTQTAHFPGRIERLYINFTGESVKKGQLLAEIYSPELISAQQELLETAETKEIQPELYEASREKLRQLKLTDEQIKIIENSKVIRKNFNVVSNTSGTVTSRRVNSGDHVTSGTVLFELVDLSEVWIIFDAYETDLLFLKIGERIKYSFQAFPGTIFTGKIAFIDPVIDPLTRVAKVRVESSNQSGMLKPEMFATGIVSSGLSENSDKIVIPKSAVLWTGKRSLIYIRQPGSEEPLFKIREVELGPMLGESYIITEGLSEGEEVVTNGTFSVDAAAQLSGKPSMLNLRN